MSIASIIYAKRRAAGYTQEELADAVGVSANAVSKWERAVSVPDIEVLCRLADYFDVTVDELLGRNPGVIGNMYPYSETRLKLYELGEDLQRLAEVSCREGFLAMEREVKDCMSGDKFLTFAVGYVLDMCQAGMSIDMIKELLGNYAVSYAAGCAGRNAADFSEAGMEKADCLMNKTVVKQTEGYEGTAGRMITEVLSEILFGVRKEYIAETIASFIGMEARERFSGLEIMGAEYFAKKRQEIIHNVSSKEPYSNNTLLLERIADMSDDEIQVLIRNLDNETFICAVKGASGGVAAAFMRNLSDRLIYYIYEDMQKWQGTEEDIINAQRSVLEEIYGRELQTMS